MKKTVAALAVLMLVGAGCSLWGAPPAEPGPTTNGPSETPPAVQEGSPPPIVMTNEGRAVAGVEGSYCYGTTCVDKIAPPQLVAEAGLDFTAVARGSDAFFTVDAQVFEFGVNIMDASGTALDIRVPVSFRDGKYTAKIPNVSGNHFLIAFVRFDGGGDVSYVFPINVR